jgi:hypothetical protein
MGGVQIHTNTGRQQGNLINLPSASIKKESRQEKERKGIVKQKFVNFLR